MPERTDLDKRQDRLEAEIVCTWAAVIAARQKWARCPSSENLEREQEASAAVDELLDEWSALRIERTAEAMAVR